MLSFNCGPAAERYSVLPAGLSFCATRIWKLGGLCVVGSTRLSVKMSVAPGVMTDFALSRNAVGSPLFCAAKKILSFDLLSPVAVTSAQRRCPSASVSLKGAKHKVVQRRKRPADLVFPPDRFPRRFGRRKLFCLRC